MMVRNSRISDRIGCRYRQAQKAAGLTVREAAARARVSHSSIQRIRNGHAVSMQLDVLIDIAKGVRVRPAWLVFGQGKGPAEGGHGSG